MPDVVFGGVKAEEAIANIRQKLDIPTKSFNNMLGAANAKGFTVAGATKIDLLSDLHAAVTKSIDKGLTLADFRKDFDEIVTKHGWQFKGHTAWRTRVIYDTNRRTAHMAGRWQQIQRAKENRPYLIYKIIDDDRTRDPHRNWNNTVLPVNHKFWNSHYPPNGWGCRCSVRGASESDLERRGLSVTTAPKIKLQNRIDSNTGEFFGKVPEGVDTGWNYNVGKAWLGPDIALGEKLANLPSSVYKTIYSKIVNRTATAVLNKSWKTWVAERNSDGFARGYAHTIGHLPDHILRAMKEKQPLINNTSIAVFDNQLTHLKGAHKKGRGAAISDKLMDKLPTEITKLKGLLFHRNEFILLLQAKVDNKTLRVVIDVNHNRKGELFNSIRSLGMVDTESYNGKVYELLWGVKE